MRALLLAFQFLTALPFGKGETVPTDRLGRSMVFFPLVGAVLGGVLILLDRGLSYLLPGSVSALLVVLAWVLLTGGLHLDGLADTADGLAGGRDREKSLAIMRDSRIGAFGAVALIFLLGLKVTCLTEGPMEMKGWALWAAPILGRWSMVLLSALAPPAREEGLGNRFLQGNKRWILTAATGFTVIGLAFLPGGLGWLLMAGIGGLTAGAAVYFRRRLGGVTGDTFGAICEIGESAVLLGVLIVGTSGIIP